MKRNGIILFFLAGLIATIPLIYSCGGGGGGGGDSAQKTGTVKIVGDSN